MNHDGRTYNLIANPVIEKRKSHRCGNRDNRYYRKRKARAYAEFTANVSHELKTPLTSISGFAELMKNGGVPEETVVDFFQTAYIYGGAAADKSCYGYYKKFRSLTKEANSL